MTLELQFSAQVIHWRGPAPFFFVPLPQDKAEDIRRVATRVSYGWGMIPVTASLGEMSFYTALFPKDGSYLLPLKADIRRKCGVTAGDRVDVGIVIGAVQG